MIPTNLLFKVYSLPESGPWTVHESSLRKEMVSFRDPIDKKRFIPKSGDLVMTAKSWVYLHSLTKIDSKTVLLTYEEKTLACEPLKELFIFLFWVYGNSAKSPLREYAIFLKGDGQIVGQGDPVMTLYST